MYNNIYYCYRFICYYYNMLTTNSRMGKRENWTNVDVCGGWRGGYDEEGCDNRLRCNLLLAMFDDMEIVGKIANPPPTEYNF